jgi:DNA-binding response OmpR family regulator
MKVLIVEDHESMREMLKLAFEKERYKYDAVDTGEEGYKKAQALKYDVIILDLMLPEKSGFDVIKQLRALKNNTPIIVISARMDEADKVRALDLGADDYLVKSFSFPELISRIKSVVRRTNGISNNILRAGEIIMDLSRNSVRVGSDFIILGKNEFMILEQLLLNSGEFVRLDTLTNIVWGKDSSEISSNTLAVHIRMLRKKINPRGEEINQNIVENKRDFGYRLMAKKD